MNLLLFTLGGTAGTRRARADRAPSSWLAPILISVLRGLGLAFFFFYPLTWGNAVSATIILLYSVIFEHPGMINLRFVVVMSAAVSLATGLAKEADASVRLDRAVVETTQEKSVRGYYIATASGFTYLGVKGEIEGFPDRSVIRLVVSHPKEAKSVLPQSIADRAVDAVGGLF